MSSRLRDFRPGSGSATGLIAPSCFLGVSGERRRPDEPELEAAAAEGPEAEGGPKLSHRGRDAGRPRFSTADLERGSCKAISASHGRLRSIALWHGMKLSFSRLVVGNAVNWDMLSKDRRASAVVGEAICPTVAERGSSRRA